MSIFGAIGGIASGIAGFIGQQAQNKFNKKQFELQKKLGDKQITYSDYILELSKAAQEISSGVTDAQGGTTGFDPATGTYKSTLGPMQRKLQDASDNEELARYTVDQALRRQGINDVEARRGDASVSAQSAQRAMDDFLRGVGTVDPTRVGNQIRLDRESAINAGYDDAAKAATTLGLRTGSAATVDALTGLARDRAKARAQIGSPELEGIQYADQINQGRQNQLAGTYNLFNTNANNIIDAGFTSAPYADKAFDRATDSRNFDLSKIGTGIEGGSAAGANLASASQGLRQATQQRNNNTNWTSAAQAIDAITQAAGGLGKSLNLKDMFNFGG